MGKVFYTTMGKVFYTTPLHKAMREGYSLPRLTFGEQVVLKLVQAGPGATLYELEKYGRLQPSELGEAVSSLMEQGLLTESENIQPWHETGGL